MDKVQGLIYLSSLYPLVRVWLACRATTLLHALSWATAAWLAWFGVFQAGVDADPARYFALCLTSCAGIAVLGARRPIVNAWNFVLLALLGVLLLPLVENALLATPLLDPLRLVFIVGTVAVGVLNYLPTRLGAPVLLVGIHCALELLVLTGALEDPASRALVEHASHWLLPAACWSGLFAVRRRWSELAIFDREWLMFRDRFGLMWSQRVREQFNTAARHAGWPIVLRWSGLHKSSREIDVPTSDHTAIVATLLGLLKRFGPVGDQ